MYYRIKLGAITNAQRAQRLLRAKGYKPTLSRIKNPQPGDGCGYMITVNADNGVMDILKENIEVSELVKSIWITLGTSVLFIFSSIIIFCKREF